MRRQIISILFFIVLLIFGNIQAAYYHVDTAAGGDGSGDSWVNGMSEAQFETSLEGASAAGDTYFIRTGLTLDSAYDSSARDGTTALYISIIGVKSGTTNEGAAIVPSDYAYLTDRPLVAAGANGISLGSYYMIRNLRITSSHANGFQLVSACHVENCYALTSGGNAFTTTSSWNRFIKCEATDSAGIGFNLQTLNILKNCYVHDCGGDGISFNSDAIYIFDNVIDSCVIGIDVSARSLSHIVGNIIYGNSSHGIYGTTGTRNLVLSNIISANAVGVEWTTADILSNYFDWNCWYNTDDVVDTDIIQGEHKVEGDPLMVNPGSGDFTLQSGSPCLDAGCQLDVNVGVADKDYTVNIGADQDDNTSGGRSAGANLGGVLQE
jgi:hypothetical protein